MFKSAEKTQEKYTIDETIDPQDGTSNMQQNDIENIDPEGDAHEIEPIDIEEVQKIQAELPPPDMDAPVGSNKNPIRIIQQGSQYITTQDVSSDHLEQIIQVLTNQALLDGSTGRPNAIYNKNTNKRIVFRVIKRKRKRAGEESTANQSIRSVKQKHVDRDFLNDSRERKRYRKDSLSSESEEDPDFEPDLPEEEILPFPIVRKKTVSGRISRPPKHLITDYKHLKKEHLEKPETSSNDSSSDAGYSDFEHGAISDKDDQEEKLKEFVCDICGLEFTTKAGLSRHRGCKHPEAGSGPGYRVGRYTNAQSALIKRRKKLQEALDEATDEDLIELVAPRMSKIVSPWDNILMRSEPGDSQLPHVSSLVFEFFSLAEQARAFITAHLEPYTEPKKERPGPKSLKQKPVDDGEEGQESGENVPPCILRVDTEEQAGSLGLTVGRYLVKQPLKEELLPDRFKAILAAQRVLADKMAEKHAGIDSGDEERFANVGYEDEPTSQPVAPVVRRGPGRPPGSGLKKQQQQLGKREDISQKYSAKKAAPVTKTSIEQSNQGSAEPQILERIHDPTLNDDLLFMAEGGLGHAIPDEWLQSGAYMAVLTESGGSSELVMEAATGKLFHKPTGHLVQLAGTGSAAEPSAEDEQVPIGTEETVEHGEQSKTTVIDEASGQLVDISAMYPGVSVENVSLGVCIVCKANGARFQVEHGGEGLTLATLQTVLEMDDEA